MVRGGHRVDRVGVPDLRYGVLGIHRLAHRPLVRHSRHSARGRFHTRRRARDLPGNAPARGVTKGVSVYGQVSILAKETPSWWPPKVQDFILPGWFYPWVTKFTVMVWIAVAIVLVFFVAGYRNPKIVPGRWQWLTESVYSFGRDGIGQDIIGHEGVRFAPYLVSLLSFIGVMNVFGILPLLQIAPTAHIAIPVALTAVSYVVYIYLGLRRHGFVGFLKVMTIPARPPLLLPPLGGRLGVLSDFII